MTPPAARARDDEDQHAERFAARLAAADWDVVAAEVNDYGCALLPRLLTPEECARTAALYDEPARFRATVSMERYRFGRGEYRYFAEPFPEPVRRLREELYPGCCPSPGTGRRSCAGPPGGRTRWPNGWRSAMAPGRGGPPRSCCGTRLATGTRCTGTCTGRRCSRCRWWSTSTSRAAITPAGSSFWSSSGPGPSRAAPPRWSRRGTGWCSPPGTGRCVRRVAGRPRRCGTACQ